MPNCAICKKSVTTGIVLCDHCAKGLTPYTLPTDLAWVIDQLSEKIILEKSIYACAMTCRNGIKAWLLSQANEFFPAKAA